MIRRNLGQVREQLTAVCGQTGIPVADDKFPGILNNAIQELANEGDWPGVVDRWHFVFDQVTAEVCLPSFLERLIDVTVDDVPLEIRSPWYEFVQYGPGIQREADELRTNRRSWVSVVMDRGEQPVLHQLPRVGGPWTLSIQADEDEAEGAGMNVQGLDENGLWIRTQQITDGTSGDWINGVDFTIGTSGDSSSQQFSEVQAVSLTPSTRNGYVHLYATNGTDTIELSNYRYDETNPVYRKYHIPQLYARDTSTNDSRIRPRVILARCRRRFVPVAADNDELMIGNVLALGEMIIAQWYRGVPDLEQYGAHKSQAVDIMRKEAMAYMGKSRTPSLTFSRGFPMASTGLPLR